MIDEMTSWSNNVEYVELIRQLIIFFIRQYPRREKNELIDKKKNWLFELSLL